MDETLSRFLIVKALFRLGLDNLVRAGVYRALVKGGFYKCRLPVGKPISGPFFLWPASTNQAKKPAGIDFSIWAADAQRVVGGSLPIFSSRWADVGFPPDWHSSVLSNTRFSNTEVHWTQLSDFELPGGDVKGYWEPARFDGFLILALAWIGENDVHVQTAIEIWLKSWCEQNPTNSGVQWKCGQEAGLRLLQVILAAELLRRWAGVSPALAFCDLVVQHCERIAPTMLYAIAQQNNHGTSEAAALFIGGAFLIRYGSPAHQRRAEDWLKIGRKWLEERIRRLVQNDGSFSQHSVNYHRLLLDTYSLVESLRRKWQVEEFTEGFYRRCRAATRWLAGMTETTSGDAPNLGANDGTRMFVLHRCEYRDYRPSVQWASILFSDLRPYPGGSYDEVLRWLDIEGGSQGAGDSASNTQIWPDGGYAKLARRDSWLLLRLPRYRFRPSQSDALHLDLWIDGHNLLRDGGSYSYNAGKDWLDYFGGVQSHNTIQFDRRDQMPRVSRFLFADWLECSELDFPVGESKVLAAYRDSWGAQHKRSVSLFDGRCEVTDAVQGFDRSAVLRWRLAPIGDDWKCVDGVWVSGRFAIKIEASVPLVRQELVQGWESRFYAQKSHLPVIEVEVSSAATIKSTITW